MSGWVLAFMPDEKVVRAHRVEDDGVGFLCGMPPSGTRISPAPDDYAAKCHICEWLDTPAMRAAATEGRRSRKSKP